MSVTIYIDESGTHNNRFMVICAVIPVNEAAQKRLKRIMKRQLVKLNEGTPCDEIHASKLTTPQKQDIMASLTKQHDYFVAYIVADKQHLVPELKARSNLCYNYLFNLLTKRLVAAFPKQDIRIISDNRSVSAGSKNSLPEYIMTEAYAKWGYTGNLQLSFADSRDIKGLQVVDVIANAVYAKYNLQKTHFYDMHKGYYIQSIKFPYATFGT